MMLLENFFKNHFENDRDVIIYIVQVWDWVWKRDRDMEREFAHSDVSHGCLWATPLLANRKIFRNSRLLLLLSSPSSSHSSPGRDERSFAVAQ